MTSGRFVAAIVWVAVGLYSVASGLGRRGYLTSLPTTAGNRRLRRQQKGLFLFGVSVLVLGLWNLVAYFRQ